MYLFWDNATFILSSSVNSLKIIKVMKKTKKISKKKQTRKKDSIFSVILITK